MLLAVMNIQVGNGAVNRGCIQAQLRGNQNQSSVVNTKQCGNAALLQTDIGSPQFLYPNKTNSHEID